MSESRDKGTGGLGDWGKKLARFFDIDTSDRSKGIQISLPKPAPQKLPQSPSLPVPQSPGYGLHIKDGKIIREGRHADSAYNDWVAQVGPAETELEHKPAGPRKKPGPPIPLDDLEYVVVDTETTGGAMTHGHRITEIAIVRVNAAGKVLHEYSTLVNPGRSIPPAITALTHITTAMVRRAPRFEEIAADVRSLLRDRVFVAHNASFDWWFINDELVRTTGRPLLGQRLCTVRLSRKVVPEVRSRSLDSLSWFFNVYNEARHRAFGDARATAVIFRRLMDRVRDREIDTWQQLEQLTLRRSQKRKRSALPMPMDDA
jgi:DNA polymerase-3 subunit epsilon